MSCGIPDFRSPQGLYSQLAIRYPELPDPQAMFDIQFFRLDPRPFFSFAKVSVCLCLSLLLPYLLKYCISLSPSLSLQEIFPGTYEPSPCHKFVKLLEERGKLLRNYTQNIDTLEDSAGIKRVIYCHGKRERVCVILIIIIIIIIFFRIVFNSYLYCVSL